MSVLSNESNGGALHLTEENLDGIIASNELVFINFYTDWCRFSKKLSPVFDKAAEKIKAAFPEDGRIVIGKVDCDKQYTIARRFHINKYPTLKLVINGKPGKRPYKGERLVQKFVEFITKQLLDPIKEFHYLKELDNLDDKRSMLIGYFDEKDVPEYQIFRRVATNLKEDCQFHVGFGEASKSIHLSGDPIIAFRSNNSICNEDDEIFSGNLNVFEELYIWAREKCVPLVREMTSENTEELHEEGLPLLILYHASDDHESVNEYKDIIANTMKDEKQNVNFLTADCDKFLHSLHNIGQLEAALPLIGLYNFVHTHVFSDFEDIRIPGKLKTFLNDLYSGKLDREYRYRPIPEIDQTQSTVDQGEAASTPP